MERGCGEKGRESGSGGASEDGREGGREGVCARECVRVCVREVEHTAGRGEDTAGTREQLPKP